MKQQICIVADVPGWAFDTIAQILKKYLSNKYEITIDYFNRRTESDYLFEFIQKHSNCDLIHFLNRRILLLMKTQTFREKVEAHGYTLQEYIKSNQKKFSTGIYDYIDLDNAGINEHRAIFNDYTQCYYTSTQELFDIYSNLENIKKPLCVVHDICDGTKFIPKNVERFEFDNIKNRPIVIGWVGNSLHSDSGNIDLKGFHSIVKPVIEELKLEGYDIIDYYADKNIISRSSDEMAVYYNKIDLLICASLHEGTPRPVLEAMHSGVPIISTDVGIVKEAFGEKQKEYIIGSRLNGKNDEIIKKRLKESIIYLYNNREIFKILSCENQISINIFDGGRTLKSFDEFFSICLKDN